MGDFLLLLPILEVARKYGSRVCLYTRSPYLALLDDDWDWLEKYDIDEKPDPFSDLPKSSLVVTFWRDLYWQEQAKILGASRTIFINPRPTDGAHFIQQAIDSLGWTLVSGWKKKSYLGNYFRGGDQTLWIHPGSGGEYKNLPFFYFEEAAQQWMESRKDRRVIFSFGEADYKLLGNFKESELVKSSRVETLHSVDIQKIRDEMVQRADKFMGNDSGPGHLAANLGIPVEIAFCGTNKSVWRPTGPRVKTYYWDADSKRIL